MEFLSKVYLNKADLKKFPIRFFNSSLKLPDDTPETKCYICLGSPIDKIM